MNNSKMIFRAHYPGFVNNGATQHGPIEFFDLDGLLNIHQVASFLSSGYKLLVATDYTDEEDLLMGSKGNSELGYVIGFLTKGANDVLGLPEKEAIIQPKPLKVCTEHGDDGALCFSWL